MNKYKVVPVETTFAMRKAFNDANEKYEEGFGESPDIQWKAMLAAAPSPWISVKERLPEDKEPILMVSVFAGPRRNYITDQYAGWRIGDNWARWPHDEQPTHWMPLPEAPEKSE